MELRMVFLHIGKRPHQIQYVCPVCETNNHGIMPERLDSLSCRGCGVTLDGTGATVEVLSPSQGGTEAQNASR